MLLDILREQKRMQLKGNIYHRTQIDMTYNSNHIEGSRLTHEQTRYIYETNTIGIADGEGVNVDDIVETVNHFRCIDMIIDRATDPLDEAFVKELHRMLKSSTSDSVVYLRRLFPCNSNFVCNIFQVQTREELGVRSWELGIMNYGAKKM